MSAEKATQRHHQHPLIGHAIEQADKYSLVVNSDMTHYPTYRATLYRQLRELAQTCDLGQTIGVSPRLNEQERATVRDLAKDLEAVTPLCETTPYFAQWNSELQKVRQDAIAAARALLLKYPDMISVFFDFLENSYMWNISSRRSALNIGFEFTGAKKRILRINNLATQEFDSGDLMELYSHVFAQTISECLDGVRKKTMETCPPHNPVLRYASMSDPRDALTQEQLLNVGACMNSLEKIAFLAAQLLNPTSNTLDRNYRIAAYKAILSAGSGIFFHQGFTQETDKINMEGYNGRLLSFIRKYMLRAEELSRLAEKGEIELTTDAFMLNQMFWNGGNREDASDIAQLLSAQPHLFNEHMRASGMSKLARAEANISSAIQLGKREVVAGKMHYLKPERRFLDAVENDIPNNVVVAVIHTLIDIRNDQVTSDVSYLVEVAMEKISQYGAQAHTAWEEILGEEPIDPMKKMYIELALMRESERKAYYARLRVNGFNKATEYQEERRALLQARSYWESLPGGGQFMDNNAAIYARLEGTIPLSYASSRRQDVVEVVVLLEKVRHFMKAWGMVPSSQFGALDAMVDLLVSPQLAHRIANTHSEWLQIPCGVTLADFLRNTKIKTVGRTTI